MTGTRCLGGWRRAYAAAYGAAGRMGGNPTQTAYVVWLTADGELCQLPPLTVNQEEAAWKGQYMEGMHALVTEWRQRCQVSLWQALQDVGFVEGTCLQLSGEVHQCLVVRQDADVEREKLHAHDNLGLYKKRYSRMNQSWQSDMYLDPFWGELVLVDGAEARELRHADTSLLSDFVLFDLYWVVLARAVIPFLCELV
eukprot:5775742-Amphidinium_carterae.1